MKAIELRMPDEVHQKLSSMAAHEHQPVDAFALRKLEELVRAVDSLSELERRARQGSREKFKAAMAKIPSVPPMPGDELRE
ncbi:MAG: toxin-antitoxin system HicB family antitoxin [Verrucomicrobia bacterium]|nr:toxin-antitoxin system HicB family antitoxin [Verrucomicrobiota bacterium]